MLAEDTALRLDGMEDALGFLLRLAQVEAFDRFHQGGEMAASLPELTTLRMIGLNPGIRQGVLARLLRIKRAHMTKIAQGLERQGFIASAIPAEDRRSMTLRLTGAGQDWLALHWPEVDRRETGVAKGLTGGETAALKQLLRKYLGLGSAAR